jgi:hypothetical protein
MFINLPLNGVAGLDKKGSRDGSGCINDDHYTGRARHSCHGKYGLIPGSRL